MYGLVAVAIVCAAFYNIFLHFLAKKKYNPFLFNALICLLWLVGLSVYNLGWQGSSSKTWIYGCLYGITLTGFIFFKTMAMANGPIALTALLGCSSFIVSTIFNGVYWKERVGFLEIAGIVLMLLSVVLINYTPTKKGEEKQTLSWKWKLYCGLYFVFASATGILFRFHQYDDKAYTDEMMILASAFAFLALILIYFLSLCLRKKETRGLAKTETTTAVSKLPIWVIALVCGGLSCLYNRLNIYNSGVLPSTLFAPIYNGGVVMASFFAGWCLFKEKPTKLQYIGAALGFLSLLSFSRLFGLL